MIARLSGVVGELGEDFAVVDVGGVGYLILVKMVVAMTIYG